MNSRLGKGNHLLCRFGACLNRLMNWNVAVRKKFPGKKIISSKIDYKLAYRQCHINTNTEIQTCTQLLEEDLEIVALCLTFRGAPGPYEWRVLSEHICDLSIATIQDAGWDPTSLCAPNGHLVPPTFIPGRFNSLCRRKISDNRCTCRRKRHSRCLH